MLSGKTRGERGEKSSNKRRNFRNSEEKKIGSGVLNSGSFNFEAQKISKWNEKFKHKSRYFFGAFKGQKVRVEDSKK